MNEDYKTTIEVLATLLTIFVFVAVFLYAKWNSAVSDHESYVKTLELQKEKDKINKPVEEITFRERLIYPQINSNISLINKDIKTLTAAVKRLEKNSITKDQINEKLKNKDIDEISKLFNDLGYTNTVISR